MQWALKRLQEAPSEQKKLEETTQQARAVKRSVTPKKSRRTMVYPVLLLALGCVVLLVAAWTASTSPALASILSGTAQPSEVERPQVWARVEIAKPEQASDSAQALVEVASTQPLPTPTLSLPTPEPTAAPATATTEPEPSLAPEETATPAGSLVLDIIADTPVPTAGPTQASAPAKPQDPPVGNGVRWIEVNLTEQRVYAWEGDVLMNSFIVSTGTWATPTVTGTFSIWNKTRIQAMSGPGYYLPDVPFVMYFYKDYGFHGTYWHNNFGTPMSHGCVNLTIPDSEWLYNWASYGTTVKVHY
jgi:lipoprotein-anchoring transpeptidase ErfK/SrfK